MLSETCGQTHQLNLKPNRIGVKPKILGLRISMVTLGLASLGLLLGGCSPLKVNQPTLLGRLSAKIQPPTKHSQNNTGNDRTSRTSAVGSGLNAGNPENGSKQATSTGLPSEHNQHTFNGAPSSSDANFKSNANPHSTVELGPFAVKNRPAEEIERIRDQAYDQGRVDAIQAGFQQQSDARTYSNPSPYQNTPPSQWQGQPTQQMPAHLAMPHLNAPVQDYPVQARTQQFNQPGSEFIDAPTDSVYADQASPGQDYQPGQGYQPGQTSQPGQVPQTPTGGVSHQFSNHNNQDYSQHRVESAPNMTQNPPRQDSNNVLRAPPGMQSHSAPVSTGHYMGGLNLIGSELRPHPQTGSEIALELQFRNEQLMEKLRDKERENNSLLSRIDVLVQKMDAQAQTLESTQESLIKSNRSASLQRETISKQEVSIQDLEAEKIRIETNADKALKEIEAELDRVLAITQSKVN